MIVYKYLHPNRMDVLANSSIRFTQPAALNDPFETLPDFTAYRESIRESITAKRLPQHREVLDQLGVNDDMITDAALANLGVLLSRHFGMLSLSRRRDHILMWSHYADSHKGFVIGFDSEDPFFSPSTGKAYGGLRAVDYSETRALLPFDGLMNLATAEREAWNERIFFTKSIEWRYEEEMRVLAPPDRANRRIAVDTGIDICLFAFQPTAIREIIAGAKCSEDLLIALLRLWIDRFPTANMFNAGINASRFEIDVKPIRREKALQLLSASGK